MSGIEVAGLVLGAYPVLTSFYGVYRDVFQGLDGWRAFRSRFEDFALSLETERLCYRNTLQSLLCLGPHPFVESLEEADALLDAEDQSVWCSEELAKNWRLRLGERYDACVLIIGRLDNVMTELYQLLDIERGQTSLPEEKPSNWWQEKFDRTRFSFSTKRIRKLSQLKTLNEDFDRLARHSNQLDKLRSTAYPTAFASFFKRIRDNANGLHDVVRGSWKCTCSQKHLMGLRLEKRAEGTETPFILQYYGKERQNGNLEWELLAQAERNASKDHAPSTENGHSVSFAVAKKNAKHSAPETSKMNPHTPNKEKAKAFKNSKTDNSKGKFDGSRISSLFRRKEQAHAASTPQSAPVRTPTKSSSSNKPDQRLPVLTGQIDLIADLCSTMQLPWRNARCLKNDVRQYRLSKVKILRPVKAASLHDLLELHLLSRRQRVKLAAVLAWSLLQLERTPWLSNGWRKDEIWLWYQEEHRDISELPFVTGSFPSVNSSTAADPLIHSARSHDHFQTTLIHFGILLLELCFGSTLESRMKQRGWNRSLEHQQLALMEYTAALDWSTEVQDEFPDFKTPIDRCLKESFGERVDWNNVQFLQKVYMNLVKPLQEVVARNHWDTSDQEGPCC